MTDAELTACIPYLQRYALRYASIDQPEDLVQDALVLALRFRDCYRGDGELTTWLTGILRRVALTRVRVLKRRPECALPDNFAALDPSPSAEERAIVSDTVQHVKSCYGMLTPGQRRAVEYDGPAPASGAIRMQRRRAIARLRERLLKS